MERDTLTFKTKGGHEIVMYSYLTGGEARELTRVYLGGMEMKVENGQTQNTIINPKVEMDAQEKLLSMLVVSLDGKRENILPRILDLPAHETEEVFEKISEVQKGLGEKKGGA